MRIARDRYRSVNFHCQFDNWYLTHHLSRVRTMRLFMSSKADLQNVEGTQHYRGFFFPSRYRLSLLRIFFSFLSLCAHLAVFLTRENRRNCHHFHCHFVHLALALVRVQIWVHWSWTYLCAFVCIILSTYCGILWVIAHCDNARVWFGMRQVQMGQVKDMLVRSVYEVTKDYLEVTTEVGVETD